MIAEAAGLVTALREVSATHQATAAQIALAWLIRRPNVVAIPGARTVLQLEENVAAADIELAEDEDRFLTEVSDRFQVQAGKTER
jgi:aryl-alcohol dehydrogenase-like predicted oxidoreductase